MRKMSEGRCSVLGQLLTEITVEPVLFLYMLSTFSQYALFQDLVYSKVCWAKYNASVCDNLHDTVYKVELDDVQTNSSHWIVMSTITLVIPSLLIAIYLGSWSDRFGRKWPVVIPPFGGALSCLVYILISFKEDAPVAWILFASSLSGLSGGFVSCIMSCMTYVAAVSTEEKRTVRISRLEAMTFLGGTIGPFVSGSMLQVTGHGYAFCFMMVSYALAVLYAIFLVRDIYDGTEQEGKVIDDDDDDPHDRSRIKKRRKKKISRRLVVNEGKESPSPPLLQIAEKCGVSPAVTVAVLPQEPSKDNLKPLLYVDSTMTTRGGGDGRRENGINNNESRESIQLPVNGATLLNERIMNRTSCRPSVWRGNSSESSQSNTSTTEIYSGGGGAGIIGNGTGSKGGIQDGNDGSHSDDEQQRNINILRRHRRNHYMNSEAGNNGRSWCSNYFGSQHLLDVLTTAFRRREDDRRLFLMIVVIAAFLAMMVTAGELDVAYYFAKDLPLNWSYQKYSYYFGFKYGLGAFMLLVGMPIFQRLELADTTICIIGLLSRMAGLVVYGLSSTTTMAFCVPVVAIFSFFTIPATRALLSKIVAPSEHGKMFSFVAIMEDLCTLSASLVFNSVYPITRHLYRGSIFFMAAALLLIPLVLIWFVRGNLVLTSLSMISSPSPTSMESGGTISESFESSSKGQPDDDIEDDEMYDEEANPPPRSK